MKEREIERKLVGGIAALGGRAYKWVSPGNAGVPDRIVFLPGGLIIPVELKTETGKLSPLQAAQIKRLRSLGAPVRVLHGLKDVNEFLEWCAHEAV